MLREAYAAPERAAGMVSRQVDANGGRVMGETLGSHCEVLSAVKRAPLTYRQRRIILWRFERGLTIEATAKRLGWSEETVTRDQRDAIEKLIRIIWDDPGYLTDGFWPEVKFRGGYGGDDGVAARKGG